ncbi:hypothetical protein ABTE62_19485, partial [Acinetobacter baumannii]
LATRYGAYDLTETIGAGYGLMQYAGDWGLLSAGVRYEGTEFRSNGFQQVAGVYQPAQVNQNYRNLLPSANLIVNAPWGMRVRA